MKRPKHGAHASAMSPLSGQLDSSTFVRAVALAHGQQQSPYAHRSVSVHPNSPVFHSAVPAARSLACLILSMGEGSGGKSELKKKKKNEQMFELLNTL
jgi:hypothetical protein